MRRRLLALALLAAAPLGARPAAAEARFEVSLDPATCTIGDPVRATLVLRLDGEDRALAARLPDWGESWGDLAILERGEVESEEAGGALVVRQELRVAAYRTGEVVAPPATALVGGREVSSAPARLTIRSVLPPGVEEPEPKPPAPARRLGLDPAFWWATAALAAAAAAAAWGLARRRRGTVEAAPAPPPLEELERALSRLAGADPERGHALLSIAFRRYLGRSCDVPVPAWSTTELARRLVRRELETDLVQRAVRLLREIDQIKFARRPADTAALERRAGETREMAGAIEARLHPPPAPGAEAAA